MTDLAEAMLRYREEKKAHGDWCPENQKLIEYSFRRALAIIGNKDLSEIRRPMILQFREALLKTRNQTGKYLSKNTVNHELTYLHGLFQWAMLNELVETNPVQGCRLKGAKGRQDQKRDAFSAEDLGLIFGPSYAKETRLWPGYRWIPMLVLHMGLRVEEAAQILVSDVVTKGPVPFIKVQPGGSKKIKTSSSVRDVPIHPALIECGFLRHVEGVGRDEVFGDLSPSYRGKRGDAVSRWFNNRLRSLEINDTTKTLYSGRHTVATRLKDLEVPEYLIMEVLGHSNQSLSTGLYGKRVTVEKLNAAAISKIDYSAELGPLYDLLKK